jgi:hypothetical protein
MMEERISKDQQFGYTTKILRSNLIKNEFFEEEFPPMGREKLL